jgi:hypothetical protein
VTCAEETPLQKLNLKEELNLFKLLLTKARFEGTLLANPSDLPTQQAAQAI